MSTGLIVDPFSKKDWYDVKAPCMFNKRQIGKTLVTRTIGTSRKFRLIAEEVQGRHVLTNFHGMNLTTDKLRSMVKKWQTLIEANIDIKTTDGYLLRLFCIGFTNKRQNQIKKTFYAQSEQVRNIRRKMVDIMAREVSSNDLKELVNKL
ncbi:hypothetical protein NP493_3994g00003 [Ridgeia piscesae]|uniref:40S ribosomal protein S3a n=1 Tax=Ridgeia piscesae TaxID=27915 RepID=A0AAD9MV32_RIDPI|nr:hypothetical protein NP493_3994g00003 [Ridgeia piscesae]